MSDNKKHGFATKVIHAGQAPDPSTGAVMMPIYATSTYAQESPGKRQGYEYSRTQNPTRMAYERCVADLESGAHGFAFASGMAATGTILELIDSGNHVIAMDDLYGGTRRLFSGVRPRFKICDAALVRHSRGILRARILITLVHAGARLHIGGSRVDRLHDRAGRRIGRLPCMNRTCRELVSLVVGHAFGPYISRRR